MKPQYFGFYYSADGTQSCALGAAFDAAGIKPTEQLPDEWGLAAPADCVLCPECGKTYQELGVSYIPHLNDDHRWTRERIADWVDIVESWNAWRNRKCVKATEPIETV